MPGPVDFDDLATDQIVDEKCFRVFERNSHKQGATKLVGRLTGVNTLEFDQVPPLKGPGTAHLELADARARLRACYIGLVGSRFGNNRVAGELGSWSEPLGAVGDESDHHLSSQPMGPRDTAHLEEWPLVPVATRLRHHLVLSRRCRPTPPGGREPLLPAPECAAPELCVRVGR